MPKMDKIKQNQLINKLKKYALIGLGGITLLFGKGDLKKQDQGSPETAATAQTMKIHDAEMSVFQKIDYIIENMLEKDVDPSTRIDFSTDTSIQKINDSEKKDKIRQNLMTYASVPLGYELLSKLDVTKISFLDTLNPSNPIEGAFYPKSKTMIMDFENLNMLPEMHHELTHALQRQLGSITLKNRLNEIDAFLNQVRYIQQANSMGIPMRQRHQNMLYDYQKYGGKDTKYIEKSLYPELFYSYDMFRDSKDPAAASESDFRLYAQMLGADESEVESFAKALTQTPIEEIKYKLDQDQEVKTTIQHRDPDGPPSYKETMEYFDEDGHLTKTIKTSIFEDSNGDIIHIVEKNDGSTVETERRVNGVLQDDKQNNTQEEPHLTQQTSSLKQTVSDASQEGARILQQQNSTKPVQQNPPTKPDIQPNI